MLDMVITGATVVDGTGAPGKRADVAIQGGRVVALGEVDDQARKRIDADGLVVAPGIIDLHTHYDAQLCWDPWATPSSNHGTTTVIGGNCGFSVAPVADGDLDYMSRLLARVEGMPLESLQAAVPWDWRSFGEYLNRFEGKLGVNAGFFVGHTAIRRLVLGDDGERHASPEELDRMRDLLRQGIEAGGLGFATGTSPTHNDAAGRPVPNRFASHSEYVELARVAGEHEGTSLEIVPPPGRFADEQIELMTDMSAAADRPINWNLLNVSKLIWDDCVQRLDASDYAAARKARIVALTMPVSNAMRLNFVSGFLFDALPVFDHLMELDLDTRLRVLASPEARALLRRCETTPQGRALYYITDWGGLTIGQTYSPENDGLQGRTVAEIAATRGIDAFDALLDVVVADELKTMIVTPMRGDDPESWKLRQEVLRDRRTVAGGTDSGAHLDMLDTFATNTSLVGPCVRDRQMLGLEEAVHMLTGSAAALYGMVDRGVVKEGAWADLFVFDPTTVGPGQVEMRYDMPAGAGRLCSDPTGVEHVLVAGREIVRGGTEITGDLPGTVLRSGRDTRTVRVSDVPY
jgi:N-acyl-D-aspartate/D-glutamate deacylase